MPRASVFAPALVVAALLSACRADLTLPPGSAVLRVAGAGTGSGIVSASSSVQPKFQCKILQGTADAESCRGVYVTGTAVALTAGPSAGSRFTRWSDACSGTAGCLVSLADSAQVVATFELAEYTLTVVGAGTGSGSVKSTAGGVPAINCAITAGRGGATGCGGTFLQSDAHLTFTASAGLTSTFSGWGGDCSGTASCSVALDQNRVVSAAFIPRPR